MNKELLNVWEHIRDLGLAALAHANRHSAYSSFDNSRWAELSVIQAAHAIELLIKARIAQEHPLLIFDKLPKMSESNISVKELFEQGKTIDYSELPSRLWACTGITIQNKDIYDEFGKLRNGIQHFSPAPSDVDLSYKTLEFIYKVIDPFINDCWGLYALDYDEDEPYIYLTNSLIQRELMFLIPYDAANCYGDWDISWENVNAEYKIKIEKSIREALERKH
jgi:hypothetical protein